MNLLILGATGGVGYELVRQAPDHGHTVTAFVRSPERLATFATRLNVVLGDLLDPGELSCVLGGQDAVLSGFGPRLPPTSHCSDSTSPALILIPPTVCSGSPNSINTAARSSV